MTAGHALQRAIVSACLPIDGLQGVFDGAPARADFPYLVVACETEKDWNSKSHLGREIMLDLSLWDDQPARLGEVGEQVEARVDKPVIATPWLLSSCRFVQRMTRRDPNGPWCCTLRLLVRMIDQRGRST